MPIAIDAEHLAVDLSAHSEDLKAGVYEARTRVLNQILVRSGLEEYASEPVSLGAFEEEKRTYGLALGALGLATVHGLVIADPDGPGMLLTERAKEAALSIVHGEGNLRWDTLNPFLEARGLPPFDYKRVHDVHSPSRLRSLIPIFSPSPKNASQEIRFGAFALAQPLERLPYLALKAIQHDTVVSLQRDEGTFLAALGAGDR